MRMIIGDRNCCSTKRSYDCPNSKQLRRKNKHQIMFMRDE